MSACKCMAARLCVHTLHCLGGVDILKACGYSGSRRWSGPRFSPGRPCLHASAGQTVTQNWEAKMASMLKGDLLYMEDSDRISLSCLVVTVGVRGPQGWRCSWLQWPQDPQAPVPTVPDTQMGQTVSLSASGAEKANSLIWSHLMESLEGASSLTRLWLLFYPLPCSLIESFHWCLWQNQVPLGKESAGDWERETKNNS